MQTSQGPPPYSRHGSSSPSSPVSPASPLAPTSPLSSSARRSSSSASSMQLGLPDDYNPLQYPPPSRVRAGVTTADAHDNSDIDPEDEHEHEHAHEAHSPSSSSHDHNGQASGNDSLDHQIGAFRVSPHPHKQNIQGVNAPQVPGQKKGPQSYQLRSPIQPKEFLKGVGLALEGCFIALTNPDFRNGRLYKTLFRLLLFTLIAHLVTQILFFLPVAAIGSLLRVMSFATDTDTSDSQRGLEIFSNKAHELMSSIPLLGLLFLRYLYPQPLDDIFVDALVYSDHLLIQEHEHAKTEKAQGLSNLDPSAPSLYVMDHRGTFAPALLAYPYRVRHWQEMWRYMLRTWKRLKWGLLFLVLSWVPVIGRFAFPIASFLSTIQSIGSKPLAVVFAVASFLLPRSVSIYLLKGFFGCRTLTRELLDPYFIRIGISHYQKRKWFNYRKSVLLGFGVVFYVGTSIPVIGVAIFGLAQASSAFVLQSLADPPPPPVPKPKSKVAADKNK